MSTLIRKYKREAVQRVLAGLEPQPLWTFLKDKNVPYPESVRAKLEQDGWIGQKGEFDQIFYFPIDIRDDFKVKTWKAANGTRSK